ncbi:MAG: NAD(P)-binding protein, partial [Steroidobacteraceae bacterium]
MNSASIAVVGAGLAGIACARRLSDAGLHVRLFESQRSPGGRLAIRWFAVASFDHGAQYLMATDAEFRGVLDAAHAAGAADRWRPDWPRGDEKRDLWVGMPGMNSLPRFLARDFDVEYGTQITRLERDRHGWTLVDDRGAAHADFSAVALALPAP